jgi:hypothetical protein
MRIMKRLAFISLLSFLAAAASVLALGSGDRARAHSGQVVLQAQHSGKCLTVHPSDQSNGALVYQWACGSGDNIEVVDTGDGWHYVKFISSGKCLTVRGYASWDGATLDQWDCVGGANQKWGGVFYEAAGLFEIHGSQAYPNKCITVDGESILDGALVNQWECLNQTNQMWATGTPPPACPGYSVSATVSNVFPSLNGSVTINGVIKCGGQAIPGVPMRVTFDYGGSVSTDCVATTGVDGTAVCGQAIDRAARAGGPVRVIVCFQIAELRSCLETSFTPL